MFRRSHKLQSEPPKLYDVYRFSPKPDITAYELAVILQRTATSPDGWPFGWIVTIAAGEFVPQPHARHFVNLAKDVTNEQAWELRWAPVAL